MFVLYQYPAQIKLSPRKSHKKESKEYKMIQEGRELVFFTLYSCLLASGSHTSFSTLPPTTNKVVTMPIRIQTKMKENPTPLKEEETETTYTNICYFSSLHFYSEITPNLLQVLRLLTWERTPLASCHRCSIGIHVLLV